MTRAAYKKCPVCKHFFLRPYFHAPKDCPGLPKEKSKMEQAVERSKQKSRG